MGVVVPGIAGWLGRRLDTDALNRLAGWSSSQQVHRADTERPTPGSFTATGGEQLDEDELHVAVVGNLDWLSVEYADVHTKRGAAASVCAAYRALGARLLDVIGGRFAIALWDQRERSGFVAVDRFGLVPVYWSNSKDSAVVFGPTAGAVSALTARPPRLRPQGIFNYLFFHMVPGPDTVFEDIHKLAAAHVLDFDDKGPRVRRYWEPAFREQADTSLRDASEEMLGLLSSSVDRLSRGIDVGAFLSGGLDSSTVAGLLARQRTDPKTYSIGFDAEGYDEIHYARIASDRFRTEFNTYYVTPDDVVDALPAIAAAYDEPFGNSSALPAYFCARLAKQDGRSRLLAGDGGDELFAGNERYVKQNVFERYQLLPRWFRKRVLEPALGIAPSGLPKLEKARSYVAQANIPLPERLQSYNFINRLGVSKVCSPALIEAIDVAEPTDLERAIYDAPNGATQLNRMLYLDWHHTLTDNDLRKVNRMCQLAGIEVEYPMLDDRLVEFSTRVSSSRKLYRGQLRGFYKRAVGGFLPDEIINKPKQGFGLPFGVWMASDAGLQTLAADYLASLRSRDFIRPGFLDELLELHRAQHAGYYGELIWILVMLAMWLEAHRL
ncbi:MAG: asparagine synthase-related protein [Chromatiaceae bacterium]|jgi:asparagine synthase (glutamine-hydrolysing)